MFSSKKKQIKFVVVNYINTEPVRVSTSYLIPLPILRQSILDALFLLNMFDSLLEICLQLLLKLLLHEQLLFGVTGLAFD